MVAVAEGTIVLAVIPGSLYIITLGIFIHNGILNPYIIFPIIITGAFLGDFLGYSIGSFVAHTLKKKKYLEGKYYHLGEKFIEKHGGKSVFLARFVSGLKEIVPAMAGVLRMKMKKFLFFNFLGAIGWSIM